MRIHLTKLYQWFVLSPLYVTSLFGSKYTYRVRYSQRALLAGSWDFDTYRIHEMSFINRDCTTI